MKKALFALVFAATLLSNCAHTKPCPFCHDDSEDSAAHFLSRVITLSLIRR